MKQKPWVCRLYPESGSSLLVRVNVWPTQKDFLAHANKNFDSRYGDRFGRRTQGTCARWESYFYPKRGARRKNRCCAVVNLHRGRLGTSVTTHELLHATIAWAVRVGVPFQDLNSDIGRTEERLCYAHGEMCRAFVDRATRAGFYK